MNRLTFPIVLMLLCGCGGTATHQAIQAERHGNGTIISQTGNFPAYDDLFLSAIKGRWSSLVENLEPWQFQKGKVVVSFRLLRDGRIRNLHVMETTVRESLATLCKRAVSDCAPYHRWPDAMALAVGKDYREIKFTFYYQ